MSDRFDAIQAFVATADARSFAAAARRLAISPSVVTRLVAGLEERLGARLLQRTTRSVNLTDPGVRFLERARGILAALDEAELSAQDERAAPSGRLAVSAPLLFGRMHIAPIVTELLAAHPQLRASLELTDRFVNLVEDGIDVAIRIGHLPDSGLIAKPLGQTRRLLVASPAYLERRGAPDCPAALTQHAMIAFRPVTPGREWRFGPDRGRVAATVQIDPVLETNSGEAAIDAAVEAHGIVAALCYQVDEPLRAGRLVEVLGAYALPAIPIQAVFPTSRLLSAKVREFLRQALSASKRWQFLHEQSKQKG